MTVGQESRAQAAASLRALTFRITSCAPQQLPQLAPQIAASLWTCRHILSTPGDGLKAGADATQTANRFRASVSQLLQARSVEERWAAVVLTKAAVEAGGSETISKAAGWTKSLIAILKKNDPSTTKLLAIVTLTRIFMLTWDDANLVREITTPTLPAFVQACLAVAQKPLGPSSVLSATLEAFTTLVPRHPTVFRTYEGQVRTLLLEILSATPSSGLDGAHYAAAHQQSARRLLVLLHHCAPKQGGPENWSETMELTVTAAHSTCDRIFRSLTEGQKSHSGLQSSTGPNLGELTLYGADALGLAAWQGLHAGAERLVILIEILRAHLQCATSGPVSLPLGMVMDLARRSLGLNASLRDQSSSFNAQIAKDERDTLFSVLPQIHVATLELLLAAIQRLDATTTPAVSDIIDTLSPCFTAECSDSALRMASYRLLGAIINLDGPTLTSDNVAEISFALRMCCEDLLPETRVSAGAHAQSTPGVESATRRTFFSHSTRPITLHRAASRLFPLLFTTLDQSSIPARLRTRMEQTAVLTQHKDALVAAVLNPAKGSREAALRPSLLPLLAAQFADAAEVEALLRPRVPMGGTIPRRREGGDEHRCSEAEEEEEEEEIIGDPADGDVTQAEDTVATLAAHGSLTDGMGSGLVPPDEVYSTAPEQTPDSSASAETHKRPAVETNDGDEPYAKRVRASGTPNPDSLQTYVSGQTSQPVTVETAASAALPETISAFEEQAEDDSDFEIPPLTMDSDSEEEGGGERGEGS